MKSQTKIEFGDFQTPLPLAREVCALLHRRGCVPDHVIEPTCGVGAFLVAAADSFPRAQLHGWDVNGEYAAQAVFSLAQTGAANRTRVQEQDFFAHDWGQEFCGKNGNILMLGNLPWVTNSAISSFNGSNLPAKENFLGLRGIEALTGKSNFDISEWMLMALLKALRARTATIAMLCKTSSVRKLLRYAWQNDGRIASAALYRIDAKKHFNASVDACLLVARTGASGPAEARMFDDFAAIEPTITFGLVGEDLVSDIRTYERLRHLEGRSPYQWRSGLKHDCASVMELWSAGEGVFQNKLGDVVPLEAEFVFPLLKCSDLANGRIAPERFVIVPQRQTGEDTRGIAISAPNLWNYLQRYRDHFAARKSSIYSGAPPFSIFGVGDYTFAPWKVAVSGLHKVPRFLVVGPVQQKPIVFDDTCYFIPFQHEAAATIIASILNSSACQEFLNSLIFADSKRPVTVDLLQRLNIRALASECGLLEDFLRSRERREFQSGQSEFVQGEFAIGH